MSEYKIITIDQIFNDQVSCGKVEVKGIPIDLVKYDEDLDEFAREHFNPMHHHLEKLQLPNGKIMRQLPSSAYILSGKLRSLVSQNCLDFSIYILATELGT
jgi:hypothetical protein